MERDLRLKGRYYPKSPSVCRHYPKSLNIFFIEEEVKLIGIHRFTSTEEAHSNEDPSN